MARPTSLRYFPLSCCSFAVNAYRSLRVWSVGRVLLIGGSATLSAGFLLMAVDESVVIHERFIEPVRAVTGVGPFGVFYYGWIVPASVLVLILGGVFFPFLRRLPRRTRTTVKWAAILYLGGALAVEMLGSAYVWHVGRDNLTYSLVTVTEEGLEMGGLIVFVYVLQTYLRDRFGEVVIRFADD